MKYLIYSMNGIDTIEPINDIKFSGGMMSTIIEHKSGSMSHIDYPFIELVAKLKQAARRKQNIVDLR